MVVCPKICQVCLFLCIYRAASDLSVLCRIKEDYIFSAIVTGLFVWPETVYSLVDFAMFLFDYAHLPAVLLMSLREALFCLVQ